ncbi:hypothetical protein Lpp78_04826 [Lacticaseibacillus paracasei subsp. paracasei CNCM I-2877]|nr:hypothetical protein Lpp78_04826 [Lacticaseibacillus paracasei subsp. paracasei CNCM I-2877]
MRLGGMVVVASGLLLALGTLKMDVQIPVTYRYRHGDFVCVRQPE